MPKRAPAGPPAVPLAEAARTVFVSIPIGSGTGELTIADSPDRGPLFPSMGPSSFAMDAAGALYVIDAMRLRILKFGADGKFVSEIPCPEGETGDAAQSGHYYKDLEIDAKGTPWVLDWNARAILGLEPLSGSVLHALDFSNYGAEPSSFSIGRDGKFRVFDGADGQVTVLDPSKKGAVARCAGFETSTEALADGYLLVLGEQDAAGRDIMAAPPSVNGVTSGSPRPFGRIHRTDPLKKAVDYQILGHDAMGRVYASVIEEIDPKTEQVQTIVHRYGPDGKLTGRLRLATEPLIWGLDPTRFHVIAPDGSVVAFGGDAKTKRIEFARYRF